VNAHLLGETLVDLALARDREGIEALMRRHILHTHREWAEESR
jgi:DNA-binding GntR family transcriptional regulator